MMRKPLIVFLLLLSFACVLAQVKVQAPVAAKKIRTDSSAVSVHPILPDKLKELKKDPDFIYTELPPERQTLWQRFWSWVWDKLLRAINYSSTNPVLKWGFITLGAALVMYIIYRFVWGDKYFLAGTKKNIIDYEVVPDDIHLINYEQEIASLIAVGNYRLAIRLLYLRSLKQLSDHKLITWQPGKTNQTYLYEVKREELHTLFSRLTRQFDYIWYGHFPIDEHSFKPLHQSFNDFNALIK